MFGWLMQSKRPLPSVDEPEAQCLALLQEGNASLASNDIHSAEQCYRRATEIAPRNALAHLNLGFSLLQLGDNQSAHVELRKTLSIDPNSSDCHYLLGGLSERLGDFAVAAYHFQRSFELKPDFELACRDACRVYFYLGQISEARDLIATGLALNPKFADFHFYEGNLHLADKSLDSALESYLQAIALGADYSALHGFVGGILLQRNQFDAALTYLRHAVELDPANTEAHHDMGVVFQRLGEVERAVEQQTIAVALDSSLLLAHGCLLFAQCCSNQCSPDRYLESSEKYAAEVRKTVRPLGARPSLEKSPCTGKQRLRIGWVSGDFRRHVNLSFLSHVIARLMNEPVDLVAFSNNPYDDSVTHELRGMFTQWHDIADLSDHDAANLIYQNYIDVLIDLAGHTAHNRLPVFAWRPAPVQVSWLGYFASTGLEEMDYLIADCFSVPQEFRSHFKEKIWYLPDTRLCMSAPENSDQLTVSPPPVLSTGYITFGCFQNLAKINDNVLHAWAEIMARVPNSRLRLQIRHLEMEGVREKLQLRLSSVGIPLNRLLLEGGTNVNAYLKAHSDVDLILDTFPYPGGTTTAEALWMGVPTVTVLGDSLLSRQGASMLQCVGLSNWIAENVEDYIEKAVHFGSDIAALKSLRMQLRAQVLASPLFDSQRFAMHFLNALHGMHQERCGN